MTNGTRSGQLLRNWRRAQGVSPEALAVQIGRSAGQLKKIENGQRPLILELAVPLARITGIPFRQLARPQDVALVEAAALMLGFRR